MRKLRLRLHKVMAVIAASAVILNTGGICTIAEETQQAVEEEVKADTLLAQESETPAPTEPVTEPPTQPPTEPPTEPPTQAPTEAPTEPPTQAPTEAPTEPPTQAPTETHSEPPTQAPTEKETQPQTAAPEVTETESNQTGSETEDPLLKLDDEETVSSLKAQTGDLEVTLTLPEGAEVNDNAVLKVKELTAADETYSNALSRLRAQTDKGHRQLADLMAWQVWIEKDGEKISVDEAVTLTFSWSSPVNPGLAPWMQGEAFVCSLGDEVTKLADIMLIPDSEDVREFTGFEISGKNLSRIGVAGVQNKMPGGDTISKKELLETLEDLTGYSAVANRFESRPEERPELLLAGEVSDPGEADMTKESGSSLTEADRKQAEEVSRLLKDFEKTGLEIADRASSDDVTFITVYADEEGKIDEEPLGGKMLFSTDGDKYLDVTDTLLVINIAAARPDQEIELPEWKVYNSDEEEGKHDEGTAGKVLYNLTAEKEGEPAAYEGELTVREECCGTVLAPAAEIIFKETLTGAVYADEVSLEEEGAVRGIALGSVYEKPLETEKPETEEETLPAEEETQDLMGADDTDGGTPGEEPGQTLITIQVKAVQNGESPSPLMEDMSFEIVDENGDPLTDVDDNPLAPKTIKSGKGTVTFKIDTSRYDIFTNDTGEEKTVVLQVRPTADPQKYIYSGSDPEDGCVTVSILPAEGESGGSISAYPETVTFLYDEPPKYEKYFPMRIRARQKDGEKALPAGVTPVYVIRDEDGNLLKRNGKEEPLEIPLTDGQSMLFRPNTDNYELFAKILPGENKTFYVVEKDPPASWEAEKEEIKFIVFRDEDRNVSVSDSEDGERYSGRDKEGPKLDITFLYTKKEEGGDPYISLRIKALLKDSEEPMPAGTKLEYIIRDENGNTLNDQDGNPLKIPVTDGKSMRLTINTEKHEIFSDLEKDSKKKLWIESEKVPEGWDASTTKLTFEVSKDKKGNVSVYRTKYPDDKHSGKEDPLELIFHYSPKTISFKVRALDEKTKKIGLSGGKIAVRMPDGSALMLTAGKETGTGITVSEKDGMKVELPLGVKENAEFAKILEEKGSVNLTVVALTAPSDPAGYTFSARSGTEYELTISKKSVEEEAVAKPKTVKLLFAKGSTVLSSDSVQVTKYVYRGKAAGIYHTGQFKYYVALFADEKLTKRVTDVKAITFTGSTLTASATFSHLTPGTYYVGETDETGRLVGLEKDKKKAQDPFYVDYSVQKVSVSGITSKVIPVSMKNHYFKKPDNTGYYGMVKVTKKVTGEDEKPKKSNGTFYFRVNDDKHNIKRISMDGKSENYTTIYLKVDDSDKEIRITEVKPRVENGAYVKDADGYYIFDEMTSGDTWTVTYKNRTVIVRQGQEEVPEVTVTNKEVSKKETETTESGSGKESDTSTGRGADTGTITMVKKATYKGNPIRLNSTFYIGIFEDAALKKARSAPVKMTLSDASEKSRSMTVNLYTLPKNKRKVTLYFAEVDSKGKALTSSSSGYMISPETPVKVTIDPQNPTATVTFTNNITTGSKMEQRLLNRSSGLAGDDDAVDDSYRGIGGGGDSGSSGPGGSGSSAKTGDNTPIGLWTVTLLGGMLVAWLMLAGRRKDLL